MAEIQVNARSRPRIATVTGWTILFFVLLRVAIGWHFFYEGVWKIKSGTFSSTPYLLASVGPLKDVFVSMVHDADGFKRVGIQQNAEGAVTGISPDYQIAEIHRLHDLIVSHYALNDAQAKAIEAFRDKKIAEATAIAQDPNLRIAAEGYVRLLKRVEAEEKSHDPKYLQQRMEFNITKITAARNGLLAQVEKPAKDMVALDILQGAENERLAKLPPEQRTAAAGSLLLTPEQLEKGPLPLPQAATFPGKQLTRLGMEFKSSTLTPWQDLGMMFGLVALGACLILGLFTRLAAFGAAVFLAMFYLSMPPWPGLPEVPPLEGHYLIVNKNLVELLACLMIMSSRIGQWFGIDAFIAAIRNRRRRRREEAVIKTAQIPSDRVYLPGEGRSTRETTQV